jgi:hypothetical protein
LHPYVSHIAPVINRRKNNVILIKVKVHKSIAAHKLHWLPKKLPEKVKIVTSTYIESTDIIILLKSLFPTDNFILVPKLGEELSCKILKSWLDGKNRNLTADQFNIFGKFFR